MNDTNYNLTPNKPQEKSDENKKKEKNMAVAPPEEREDPKGTSHLRLIDSAISAVANENTNMEEAPLPLKEGLPHQFSSFETHRYLKFLPDDIKELVQALYLSDNLNPAVVTLVIMHVLSVLFSPSTDIEYSTSGKKNMPLTLYGVIIGDAASGKGRAIDTITGPLLQREKTAIIEENKKTLVAYELEKRHFEDSKADPHSPKVKKPRNPTIKAGNQANSTYQALIKLFSHGEGNRHIRGCHEEGSVFLHEKAFKKETEATSSVYNQLWDGRAQSMARATTTEHPAVFVEEDKRYSLLLAVQPEPYKQAPITKLEQTGFMSRLLKVVLSPMPPAPVPNNDKAKADEKRDRLLRAFEEKCVKLLNSPTWQAIENNRVKGMSLLTTTPHFKKVLALLRKEYHSMAQDETMDEGTQKFLLRGDQNALRITALLHLWKNADKLFYYIDPKREKCPYTKEEILDLSQEKLEGEMALDVPKEAMEPGFPEHLLMEMTLTGKGLIDHLFLPHEKNEKCIRKYDASDIRLEKDALKLLGYMKRKVDEGSSNSFSARHLLRAGVLGKKIYDALSYEEVLHHLKKTGYLQKLRKKEDEIKPRYALKDIP